MPKAWKAAEARAAAKFGTRRAPLSGSNGGITGSDTLSDGFYIECKYRKHHAWVSLFHEVEEAAKKECKRGGTEERQPKFPVLVLAERGRHRLFVVAPLNPGYLEVLIHELKRLEKYVEVPPSSTTDSQAANNVACTDLTDRD